MSPKYKISTTNHNSLIKNDVKHIKSSSSPEVITISDTPSPASPPALISTNSAPGVIHGPSLSSGLKLDESLVLKTIENSRKYRDFVMRQNNVKRNFQKQMDKKVSTFPYPKTFRQVWPIVPVQDPSFVKNLGLETVTQFFEHNPVTKSSSASKVKPICNQCGCDFASAWQIRKNNSKQVLLCESCDFANLKLLQRTKLSTQLKEVVESVRREEEKFDMESDEARKHLFATERVMFTNKTHSNMSQGNHMNRHQTLLDRVGDTVIPSILPVKTGMHEKSSELLRKRRLEHEVSPLPSKTTKTHLDFTLNRITQQLLLKQVDEKVQQHRHHNTPPIRTLSTKTPPPLEEVDVNHTSILSKKTPPPLTSVTPSSGGSADSRRNRRKGQPRQNLKLSNSSDVL